MAPLLTETAAPGFEVAAWSGNNRAHSSSKLGKPPLACVVVAEWLRRWTRNPLGSARAGSNPADYEVLLFPGEISGSYLRQVCSSLDKKDCLGPRDLWRFRLDVRKDFIE